MKSKHNPLTTSTPLTSSKSRNCLLSALTITLCLAGAERSMAQTLWDGGGTTDNFSDGPNWVGDAVPLNNFGARTFVGEVRNNPINDISNTPTQRSIGIITFANDGTTGKTNAFNLSGNALVLGGNVITTAIVTGGTAITDEISLGLILNAGRTMNINTNHNVLISGVVSENGSNFGLTKSSPGTLTLSGANTFTGAISITGGTVRVANVAGLGFGGRQTTANNGTTVTNGAIDLNGTTGINEPITLNGTGGSNGALINNNSVTTAVIENGIAGLRNGSALGNGSGYSTAPTITISGTGTGATATALLGLTTASIASISNGGTNWAVNDTLGFTGGGGAGAVATVTSVNAGVITGLSITSPGGGYTSVPTSLTKISGAAGTTNPTITGDATQFTVGAIAMTNAGSGYTGTPTYTFSDGNAVPSTVALSSVILATNSSIGGSGNTTINAVVSETGGARALSKVGAGMLTLSASNTYTGGTLINGGTLMITGATQATSSYGFGGAGVLGFNIASPVTAANATVDFTGRTVLVEGTPTLPSYTLLTASSITGTPTLAAPAPAGYTLSVVGNQLLLVLGGADPFSEWVGTVGDTGFDQDLNKDGVDNGLAWLLGAPNPNDNANSLLPVVTQTGGSLKLNFDMLPASARNGAKLIVEHSSDLGITDSWTGVVVPDATGGTAPVTFVVSGTSPLDVEVTISSSEAGSGKLFGRLRAEK